METKEIIVKPMLLPVQKTIEVPGSKSYTNRALLMATLTKNPVKILYPLKSDDTRAMIFCLSTLGIEILETYDSIEIQNDIRSIENKHYLLDANRSGTTIRFLLALSSIIPGVKTLTGKESLLKRPIKDLVDALRKSGAEISYLKQEGHPPLKITSNKLTTNFIKINGSISSQYTSALLMIAPLIQNATIEVTGEQISKPYIDMTIDTMKQFGVTVTNKNYRQYNISGNQTYHCDTYVVEPDVSSASYFFAIAALTKSEFTFPRMNPDSKQADMAFLKILERMGNKIVYETDNLTIAGTGVKPVTVDMENCPDQAQTLAVLAAFADGTTTITGIRSLRVKETERIVALQKELEKMGIQTEATQDTLTIFGGNPKPATIDTYDDHRMAMAFAVAGTKLPGMRINNPTVVEKTFPDFWEKLKFT